MLHQTEEEKKLTKKIYEIEQESRKQQERLKLTLDGNMYDQSMSKRGAESEGGNEYKKEERWEIKSGRRITRHRITTSRTAEQTGGGTSMEMKQER